MSSALLIDSARLVQLNLARQNGAKYFFLAPTKGDEKLIRIKNLQQKMDVNFGVKNANSAENCYEIRRGNLCEHPRENLGEICAKIRVKNGAKIGAKIDAKICVFTPLLQYFLINFSWPNKRVARRPALHTRQIVC